MPTNVQTSDLPALIAEATALGAEFERRFGGLSATQLNWRPNPEEWSIGYCVEHVIVVNSGYFAPIGQILAGTKASSFWERLPLLPGLFGGFLIRTLEPGAKGFVPAPKAFLPGSTDIPADVMDRFMAQQRELLGLMERCRTLDTATIIVTSPAADFVTYSLLDAFRIIVVHLQHHLHQTSKLLAMAEFPAS
ncbi:DinB family protein [Chloroflexales bacterium ZM16-3]|nr:DinB family protein [Chloroflexales bacterium ZM16-3]